MARQMSRLTSVQSSEFTPFNFSWCGQSFLDFRREADFLRKNLKFLFEILTFMQFLWFLLGKKWRRIFFVFWLSAEKLYYIHSFFNKNHEISGQSRGA